MNECRICKNTIEPFMTFGKMPIANGFLKDNEFKNEYFYDLSPAFCNKCFSFQLINQPDPKMMFHENYAFFSKTSKFMQIHFKQFSDWIEQNYFNDKNPFIIEIGSNDGILLENFAKKNIDHLGIEPSSNVAENALKNGVNTITKFFNESLTSDILENYRKADCIVAANVMCHIPDLNEIGKCANSLLKEKGVLIFEDPYLLDMLQKVSYDQIYDEHVFMFSAHSVNNIFKEHNLEIIELIHQKTHGGSMRYVLGRKNQRQKTNNVNYFFEKEKEFGLDKFETYIKFKNDCEISKKNFVQSLKNYRDKGKKIAGYGATSKSTTVLNYCEVDSNLIEYISDTTPIKQNKFSPGMHIPIKTYDFFLENIPDIAVLFAWNHKNEIINKEKNFVNKGGKFISHVNLNNY